MLVRLLTGQPPEDFEHCVSRLRTLIEEDGAEVFASNQVHRGGVRSGSASLRVSKADARAGLTDVLRSGLVDTLNGGAVFDILDAVEARSVRPAHCRRILARGRGGLDSGPQDGVLAGRTRTVAGRTLQYPAASCVAGK